MIKKLKFITSILYGKINNSLFILLTLMLFGMIFEFVGLGVIFPLILSLIQPNKLLEFELIDKIYHFLSFTSISHLTYLFLFIILIVYIIKTGFMVYFTHKQNIIISNLTGKISHSLYKIYLNQPFSFHTKNNSSILIKNIQVEINYLSSFLMSVVNIIIDLALIFSLVITLILVEPIGAISVALYFVLAGFIYYQIVKPFIKKWGETRGLIEKSMISTLIEGLQSIRELILFGGIKIYTKKFEELNNQYANVTAKNNTSQQIPRFFFELSAILGILLFVTVLITLKDASATILTVVGVFTAAVFRIIPSLNRAVYSLQNIKFYSPSVNLIYNELNKLDLNFEIKQPIKNVSLNEKIKFTNVFFKYDMESNWILENINLTIKKGEFIGLKGESGSGKSTLIDLLAGIYKPNKGKILVDQMNINFDSTTTQNWTRNIGYVPQSILLIDDTIKNNIILGMEPEEINQQQIMFSIEKSGLKKFINSLSHGLDTIVGERGVKLSGGQKQRIGIARALYKNPSILFLDEGTSALDDKTEKGIIESIRLISNHKTIIMISHKLSTLKYCDKVYEINKNKIELVC